MFVTQFVKRRSLLTLLLVALSLMMLGAAPAHQSFPDTIPLPNGFQPEGIASGRGTTFYVGSIPTGAVYRGDLRSGEGAIHRACWNGTNVKRGASPAGNAFRCQKSSVE